MPILQKSINIDAEFHTYIAFSYRKISDIIEDPVYASIIINRIEEEQDEVVNYIYKLLSEWDDSLEKLIKVSNKLVK